MKRTYNIKNRKIQAKQTKERILNSAKRLFEIHGLDGVTIESIANDAEVSVPSVYSLFKSKIGILSAVIDMVIDKEQFEILAQKASRAKTLRSYVKISAQMASQMYNTEKTFMNALRGASSLSPELKKIEKVHEERRYQRQEESLKIIANQNKFKEIINFNKARDILWAFTGRDMFRLLVIERGWELLEYEKWLAESLYQLLKNDFVISIK
ncbi:TetR/AcrR family transcriptional regulator [Silvanigrella aquatica]|uniref:HTH tetR-type domain-containing protein n=1 Tax=Silvanigrella aquatica TaxID=1915309 RepID=A0A1L4D0F0_9BACT|nr:TetR/AcrR family transcriptional regulator [Silvanigrella aquatica]APJ03681.1 hypothetical protein AXG55_07090 [Silvanigrella aquatica]